MLITSKLEIDLHQPGFKKVAYAVQSDSNTRALEISLFLGSTPWEIPSGTTAAVSFRKMDLTSGLYDTLPDGSTKAVIFSGNTLTAILAPQVLTCAGKVDISIALYDSSLNRLGVFPVLLYVSIDPSAGKSISNNYYYLSTLAAVNEAIGDLNVLKTSTKESLVAAINELAQGTVTEDQIQDAVDAYLEKNGTGSILVDPTLTKEGYAADAKATGEAISKVSGQNINPVAKTDDMTQPVGVDENGLLWTAPTVEKAETIALSGWTYGYIMETGEFLASGTGYTSDYVKVRKGKVYTIVYPSSVAGVRFAIYDSDKNYLSRIIDGTVTYTATADGYVRITTTNAEGYEDVYLTVEEAASGNSGGTNYAFLHGLKYYAMGDSIVDMQGTLTAPETFGDSGYSTDLQSRPIGDMTVEGYVTAIERRYGLVATNYGKGGHTLVGDYSTLASMNYSDVALVTIAYGVNDARTGVPLGTVNSTDVTTFAGALNQLLRKIYTDNPECRVLVLSPMQRLTVTDFGIDTPNANGNYLIDFVNMCKAIAEKRSTAFLDQYRCTGINQTNLYYYTVEGVHPVNQGFARIRNAVIGILDELFALEYEPIGVMTNTGDTEPEEPDTGGDSGGEEPPEDDNATVVDISDQFTRYGVDMDGWGTGIKTSASQSPYVSARYHPESNVTYTIVTYGEASLLTATDRRQWSSTVLNDDGTVKSGDYRYTASGGRGEADTYESVTIDGVEYAKMTAINVTSDVEDNRYWNIPCLANLVDHVKVSYI